MILHAMQQKVCQYTTHFCVAYCETASNAAGSLLTTRQSHVPECDTARNAAGSLQLQDSFLCGLM
jgi:hypothetical protein